MKLKTKIEQHKSQDTSFNNNNGDEPKLLLTHILVLPCRRAEFKNSQLLGNGKIKFYSKEGV